VEVRKKMRNYSYKKITSPINDVLSLSEIKLFLRLDTDDTSEDTLLSNFLCSAVSYVEKYTNRTLLTTQYITYRDNFFNSVCGYWELRKSPLQQVDSIKYYNSGNVLTAISEDVYYSTLENDYSKILLNDDYLFPSNKLNRLQSIEITFTAGYGDTSDDVPCQIKEAILLLIAAMYENRGDCDTSCSSLANCSVKSLLSQFRIINI